MASLALRRFTPKPCLSLFSTFCLPPCPKKVPFTVSVHGYTWQDPYHWMRNTDDPDFVSHLGLENSYAEAFMSETQKLQRALFSEMKSRMPARISTAPDRWGPWLYYQYIPEDKEYPVLCRRLTSEKRSWVKTAVNYVKGIGGEEVLLDWNEIAEQYGYVHIGTCRISPDHNFLAYTIDISGSEKFMLQVKDLKTMHCLPNLNVEGVVSLAWAQDSCTLFYTMSDENQRPYRVLATNLEADSSIGVPLFTETDSSCCVDITSTKDGRFITVNSNSRTSSEIYTINAGNPHGGIKRLCKRRSGVQYFLEHHSGFFYILTNAPAEEAKESLTGRFYLCRCRVEEAESSSWQIIVVPSEGSSINDMDIFMGHLVLFLNKDGCSLICSIDMPKDAQWKACQEMDDLAAWYFPVPTNSCTITPGSNHAFTSSVYRAVLSSPVMPDVIVDYDMSTRTFSVVQQEEVLGIPTTTGTLSPSFGGKGEEVSTLLSLSDLYACERKEVLSHDGVLVPLTILYSKKAHKGNQSPGILLGYGAYDEVLDKSWCADRLSLLDRGWVVAFADVRGGGGVDPCWHESGSGLNKLNSIHDFVCCGKYLVSEGHVNEAKLGAVGHSAGGLLVGAAINMHPELFGAAILKVPFLDICNTLLDPSLPLTILDYEEFGNPQIKAYLEYILRYSPYDNICQGVHFPPVLVTASLQDSRVGAWEAAKWVAKVRDSTCSSRSRFVILNGYDRRSFWREWSLCSM